MKKIFCLILAFFTLLSLSACKEEVSVAEKEVEIPKFIEGDPELPPQPDTFEITLSFVGDVLLASQLDITSAGSFNEYANTHPASYFFEKVRHIFEADDFTIVNVENVFTDKYLEPVEKGYTPAFWFKSRTSNVEILTSSSVEGVSLANNHISDYGPVGMNDTKEAITNAGLPFGIDGTIMYFEKRGFTVAVICHGMWAEYQANTIANEIKIAEQQSDYQIVFFHGGTEKLHRPEDWKVRSARKLVDSGADMVIGNHPHVLQPREIYNGVEIIYSIGNFCFGGNMRPENRTIIYQMNISVDWRTNTATTSRSDYTLLCVYRKPK